MSPSLRGVGSVAQTQEQPTLCSSALVPQAPDCSSSSSSNTPWPGVSSGLCHRQLIPSSFLPSFLLFLYFIQIWGWGRETDVQPFGQLNNLSCGISLNTPNKKESKELQPPLWQVWLNCLGMICLYYIRHERKKKKGLNHPHYYFWVKKKKPFLAYWRLHLGSEKKFSIHSLLLTIKELATNRAFKKELIIVSEKTIAYPNVD